MEKTKFERQYNDSVDKNNSVLKEFGEAHLIGGV